VEWSALVDSDSIGRSRLTSLLRAVSGHGIFHPGCQMNPTVHFGHLLGWQVGVVGSDYVLPAQTLKALKG